MKINKIKTTTNQIRCYLALKIFISEMDFMDPNSMTLLKGWNDLPERSNSLIIVKEIDSGREVNVFIHPIIFEKRL